MKRFFGLLFSVIFLPLAAWAGDAATIVFREGHIAYISNGYAALVQEYKNLNEASKPHKIIELKIESSPFLINLSEVVIVCRDRCTSLEVIDPRRSNQK